MDRKPMNNQPPNAPARRNPSNEIQHREENQLNSTIIADRVYGQEELIEIQISEEFREMNINCPGDSEMLDICLSEPEQIEMTESNINSGPNDQVKQNDQPNGNLETPATASSTFEQPQSISQYIPTRSHSHDELQPSTSKHCSGISRTSEVNKEHTSILQCIPIHNLSLEDLQPSTSKHCRAIPRTSEVNKQPTSISKYIPTRSLSPEELQPSTSKHCQAISRTSEVFKQPQCVPTRHSLSPEELQPSTSKHCRIISRSSKIHSISPEELKPSTSNQRRGLLSKDANSQNKIGKKQKKPKRVIAQISPIRLGYIAIGPNRSLIEANALDQISWDNPSTATRMLMSALFFRETLATHSLTGRRFPGVKKKSLQSMLDQRRTEDIIYIVSRNCGVSEKEVRRLITTKCANENKMLRLSEIENQAQEEDEENDDA